MRARCITAAVLVARASCGPLLAQGHQDANASDKRQYKNQSAALTTLLDAVVAETTIIDYTLDLYRGPITGGAAKAVTLVVGAHFGNIAEAMRSAHALLAAGPEGEHAAPPDERVQEQPSGAKPIAAKTRSIVRVAGKTTHKSISKLGLTEVGKFISPVFLVLSAIVVALNSLLGGALLAVATLVNGLFLAIAAGLAYLGHLVSENERQRVGGPAGYLSRHVGKTIGDTVGGNLGL